MLSSRATDLLGQVETGMTTLQDRPAKSFVCVVVIGRGVEGPLLPPKSAAPLRLPGLGEIAARVILHAPGRLQFQKRQTRGGNHPIALLRRNSIPVPELHFRGGFLRWRQSYTVMIEEPGKLLNKDFLSGHKPLVPFCALRAIDWTTWGINLE